MHGGTDWGALALPLTAVAAMFLLEEAFYAASGLVRTKAGSRIDRALRRLRSGAEVGPHGRIGGAWTQSGMI